MSSPQNHHQSSFPAVPSSLSAGSHGMTRNYAEQERTAPRDIVYSPDDLTPYLGLRARLSQVWLNRWTILILLVLARVLIAIGNLHDRIDRAESDALAACTTVESMGSAMASMPHYMAQGTNELAAKGVVKAVNGLESMLFLTISGLEEIFVFWVNMLYGTYTCLIAAAVTSSAHSAVKIAEDVNKFLNKTLGEVQKDLKGGVGDVDDALNKFMQGFGKSVPFGLAGPVDPPKIDFSKQINALNIKLPDDIDQGLKKLNSSLPTFDEVMNLTDFALRKPFDEVKLLIKNNLGPFEFNSSVFPVPQKEQLSFCRDDNGIADFFDGLYDVADTARKIFIAVLLIAAILACVPMALLELRRWRTMRSRAKLVVTSARDPLDVVYIAARPFTASTGLKLSRNFSSEKRRILLRWFVAYITSFPALFVLAVAFAGYFSCLCQYILLQAIKKEVPALAGQVTQFADTVVHKLDNASSAWANGTNTEIMSVNNDINQQVLGWVNTSTVAVNDTLNSFVNHTTDVLHKAFDGTILAEPMMRVFDCLIGLKVAKIEKGLTWAHDHAHVDFPLFPNDTFSQGASKALAANDGGTNANGDSFLADPSSGASDKITAAVVKLVDKLVAGIRIEALIATGVLLCYVAVVLLGLAWVAYRMARPTRVRATGGGGFDNGPGEAHDMAPVNPMDGAFARNRPTRRDAYEAGAAAAAPPPQHASRSVSRDTYVDDNYAPRKVSEEVPRYEESNRLAALRGPMPGFGALTPAVGADEKTGYAGRREPAGRNRSPSTNRGVVSEYGVVEKH